MALSEDVAIRDPRSKDRLDFCQSVVSRAKEIVDALIQNPHWRRVFQNDRDSIHESGYALKGLLTEAKNLINNLEKFRHNDYDPLFVMVFDEASSLLKEEESNNLDLGRYHALNRVLSCLKKFPMWFFFLSTEP